MHYFNTFRSAQKSMEKYLQARALQDPLISLPSHVPVVENLQTPEVTYIGNSNFLNLSKVLTKLVPSCPDCGEKMMIICLEDCCVGQSLRCTECHSHRHLELQLFFLGREHILDPHHTQVTATLIIELLKEDCAKSKVVVEKQLKLVDLYNETINKMEEILNTLDREDWLEEIYQSIEMYFNR